MDLTNFNTACNGADWGDFASSGTPQVQDAFGTPGSSPAYGANEIAAMSAIGYTPATPGSSTVPEPATLALVPSALVALAWVRRRRTAGSAGSGSPRQFH